MPHYHATYVSRANKRRRDKEADEAVARYVAKPAPQHRTGETKQFGGHTYRLNEHSRWERQDKEQAEDIGRKAVNIGKPGQSIGQQPQEIGSDHAARHAFTQQQLGSVQGPAKGVIAAMQAHPDISSGKDYLTKDFAPEQAGNLHNWLSSNAGKEVGGGQVRDLGNGSFGFSSPAGAVVTQNIKGKFRVFYTNKTGLVAQAMGQSSPPKGPAGATSPPITSGALGQSPFAPPAGERPQFAPGTGQNQLTPEAAAASGALTAAPEKPAAPPRPSTPRAAADEAKARLEEATHKWNEELAGGLSPKGNARWRSYTAALRSIASQHDKIAKDWEKQSKPDKGGGKPGGAAPTAPAMSDHEQAAHESAPVAFKELQDMRPTLGETAYQDAVQQLAGQGKPWERRAAVGAPPQKKEAFDQEKPLAGLESSPTGSVKTRGTEAAPPSREQEAMRRMGISPPTKGEAQRKINERTAAAEAGPPPKFISDWPASPESKRKPIERPEIDQDTGTPLRLPQNKPRPKPSSAFETSPQEQPGKQEQPKGGRHEKLLGLADKYFEHFGVQASDKNKAAITEAIKGGQLQNPKDIRGVLNAAKGLLSRGKVGDEGHEAVAEALRRKVARAGQERSPSWQATVKAKADEWDMEPKEFESLAADIHKEFVGHHGEREAARKAASKLTGLTAGDVNRLENQGYDSGSDHPKIKRLDEIGRDLASQYPALGWGRGREGDEGESDVDYGERLWDLIRTGAKGVPGRTSPEFLKHVEDYLQQQMRSAGSSRGSGGAVATDDDLKHVPFAKRRDAIVARYARWLQLPVWDRRAKAR